MVLTVKDYNICSEGQAESSLLQNYAILLSLVSKTHQGPAEFLWPLCQLTLSQSFLVLLGAVLPQTTDSKLSARSWEDQKVDMETLD